MTELGRPSGTKSDFAYDRVREMILDGRLERARS